MGCFDCTCALTRTSIHSGDEVLYVQVTSKYNANTYNLLQEFYRIESERRHLAELREQPTDDERYSIFLDLQEARAVFNGHIAIGIYNDYGSIEGYDNDEDLPKGVNWDEVQFMIHREAAEIFLGEKLDPGRLMEQLKMLVVACFTARIQLFGHYLLGAQHFDTDELRLQDLVVEATQAMIEAKRDYIRTYWEDDDEV